MKAVQWKGITVEVEYDLFTAGVKELIQKGYTKEEALDEIFDMLSFS